MRSSKRLARFGAKSEFPEQSGAEFGNRQGRKARQVPRRGEGT
ncbi:hypothetical protein [Adhaeretor mobilis]|nr:hypothetical protein [Adhaeretor mobilis]